MKNQSFLFLCFMLGCFLVCGAQNIQQNVILADLMPFALENATKQPDYKSSLEKHTTLLKALKASKLDIVLGYKADFTVLAPSNKAFEKLTKISIEQLLDPKNQKVLKSIMSRHIIAGKLTASSILLAMSRGNGTAKFTTIHGDKVIATLEGVDIVLTDKAGNQATIVAADSNYSNGVVHEINSVFLPKILF